MDQPRVPAGSPEGGQFAGKNRGYSFPAGDHDEQMSESDLREFTRDQWGKELSRDDVAELAGAQPGSRVTIGFGTQSDELGIQIEFMGNDGFPIGRARRFMTGKTIFNSEIEFDKGFKGRGRGLQVFSQQVDAAVKQGFDSIECEAAGNYDRREFQNGYYTWARMGYDGVIPNGYGPAGEKMVSEVMARPDGAAWWLVNGEGFSATFLLHEGSTSRRVFNEYRRLKGL